MALSTGTHKEYYDQDITGGYQFISMTDIINNFIVANVGDDKIIKSAKRAEIMYHAQRGIQELNYDTLGSIQSQEIEVPPSLSVQLPHNYVKYIEVYFVNDAGVKYPLRESTLSFEPTPVLQDADYNYLYDNTGQLLTSAQSETRRRFKEATNDDISNEDGSDTNVDYGKRYGINPEFATKNGFFTINNDVGTISFTGDLNGKLIVIQYISDGLYADGDMIVHKFAEEAMYKSITYGVASAKTNIPEYQINRFKKEKRASIRQAKLRLAKISVPEIIQSMRIKAKQIKH